MEPLVSTGSRLTVLLMVMLLMMTALLVESALPPPAETTRALAPAAVVAARVGAPPPGAPLAVPDALAAEDIDLRSGPVAVPLELQMPSLGVNAPVTGVGITPDDVMDAPTGPAKDPVWQRAFWYRGSAVPGAPSTALIAGHVSGLGSPGVFAHIDALTPGDPIVVHDTRSGLEVRFSVTGSKSFPLDETTDPAVLDQIYGAGPVAGTPPQPSADGLSHLTLITCAGTFRKQDGTHDRRLVVFANRMA